MQLKMIEENPRGEYWLEEDTTHLINFKKGILLFPSSYKLCRIQIIFAETGKIYLDAGVNILAVGTSLSRYFACEPGMPGFDTFPEFVFNPKKNTWHATSRGNFIIYPDRVDRPNIDEDP